MKDGAVVQVESPEFVYCVFFPKHLDKNGHIVKNYVDGVKANEADTLYDAFFEQNDKFYTALAVCIHEVWLAKQFIYQKYYLLTKLYRKPWV